MKKMFCVLIAGMVFSITANVFAASKVKVTIPDQPAYPVVVAGEWLAKVIKTDDNSKNEKVVIKFQIGYSEGGSGFTKIKGWTDKIKYKNIYDDPGTPGNEESLMYNDWTDASKLSTSNYEAWIAANLPADWPDPQ